MVEGSGQRPDHVRATRAMPRWFRSGTETPRQPRSGRFRGFDQDTPAPALWSSFELPQRNGPTHTSFDCLPDESDQSIHRVAGLDCFPCPPTMPVIAVPGTTRCTTSGTVHTADTPPTNRRGAAWKPGVLGGCGASQHSTGPCKAVHGVWLAVLTLGIGQDGQKSPIADIEIVSNIDGGYPKDEC